MGKHVEFDATVFATKECFLDGDVAAIGLVPDAPLSSQLTAGDRVHARLDVLSPVAKESLPLQEKIARNIWDSIDDVLKVVRAAQRGDWCWSRNSSCKYLNLRLDMRDGGCIIYDRDGKRISPEQLAYQYGKEPLP